MEFMTAKSRTGTSVSSSLLVLDHSRGGASCYKHQGFAKFKRVLFSLGRVVVQGRCVSLRTIFFIYCLYQWV